MQTHRGLDVVPALATKLRGKGVAGCGHARAYADRGDVARGPPDGEGLRKVAGADDGDTDGIRVGRAVDVLLDNVLPELPPDVGKRRVVGKEATLTIRVHAKRRLRRRSNEHAVTRGRGRRTKRATPPLVCGLDLGRLGDAPAWLRNQDALAIALLVVAAEDVGRTGEVLADGCTALIKAPRRCSRGLASACQMVMMWSSGGGREFKLFDPEVGLRIDSRSRFSPSGAVTSAKVSANPLSSLLYSSTALDRGEPTTAMPLLVSTATEVPKLSPARLSVARSLLCWSHAHGQRLMSRVNTHPRGPHTCEQGSRIAVSPTTTVADGSRRRKV